MEAVEGGEGELNLPPKKKKKETDRFDDRFFLYLYTKYKRSVGRGGGYFKIFEPSDLIFIYFSLLAGCLVDKTQSFSS